ncbi:MAG: endo-1,4-beta-xylanase [Pyrinomonadaceae bacterium]|nr:endo-1,4-beta-xylanase [Pyrinomonadaceae bacterium]
MFVRAGKFLLLFWLAAFASSCASSAATTDGGDANAFDRSQNQAALTTARNNIGKFRQGSAQIKIVDGRGKPIKSAKIQIKQISHDFKFGCYLKIDDLAPEKLPEYERHFSRLFNFAVIGTYWDFVENKRGAENWTWFERETALADRLNWRIQAAPLIWGTNEAGTPNWLPRDKNELDAAIKNHVESVLKKYQNRAEDWEIVNEPLALQADFFAQNIGSEYIETAFRRARQAAPTKRLMINEYGVFGAIEKHNYNREKYFELVKKLIEKDVPIDVIGIQAHGGGEWFAPANVAEQLERYAALGKPLQITEFSAQTLNYDDRQSPLSIAGNYRKGVWDAEKQAEFYREFYTIAFGNRHVEAITTWGLDDERAWLPGIGLIDANGKAKPNYETLNQLINKDWRTDLEIKSDHGVADFRGFYGSYEVEIFAGGKRTKAIFELKKIGKNEWLVTL